MQPTRMSPPSAHPPHPLHLTRKGLVVAGGRGTRLYPLTAVVNKHLLPVHDKPMIYYPLSTLMLAGLREILIVSSPRDLAQLEELLGNGDRFGVRFIFVPQAEPRGIADALVLAGPYLGGDGCVLALGDNLFWGHLDFLRAAIAEPRGATIFAYRVKDPSAYGVVELDAAGHAVSVQEKPSSPRSTLAIPGLYVFDGDCATIASRLSPSARGELEITDVHRAYLERGDLRVMQLGRGMAWLDMGTVASLLEASALVGAIQERQGQRIGCLEECALRMGYCTRDELRATIATYGPSEYRDYIESVLDE
jgi:glucose-1-phosphate thymidylyltransferase